MVQPLLQVMVQEDPCCGPNHPTVRIPRGMKWMLRLHYWIPPLLLLPMVTLRQQPMVLLATDSVEPALVIPVLKGDCPVVKTEVCELPSLCRS